MGRWITATVAIVLLAILIAESLLWDNLEELNIPHITVGVIVGLFVLLALFWIVVAIRNHRRGDH